MYGLFVPTTEPARPVSLCTRCHRVTFQDSGICLTCQRGKTGGR